jgi:hypothetical protein
MNGAEKMKFRAMMCAAAMILSSDSLASAQNNDDLRGALTILDPVIQGASSFCRAADGKTYAVSAAVVPAAQPNPFTPQLGAPTSPGVAGYLQFALYVGTQGHYIWRMTFPALPVSSSDHLNGIDARFQVDLYAMSYRTYDTQTGRWGEWTTKGSFGNDVHFAQFIVERKNGIWNWRGTLYMQPLGTKLQAVDCRTAPPLT